MSQWKIKDHNIEAIVNCILIMYSVVLQYVIHTKILHGVYTLVTIDLDFFLIILLMTPLP